MFFILIFLHTVTKIGMYGWLFTLRHMKGKENCKKACVAVLLRFIHIITALYVNI